jgi:hypothetical protein
VEEMPTKEIGTARLTAATSSGRRRCTSEGEEKLDARGAGGLAHLLYRAEGAGRRT